MSEVGCQPEGEYRLRGRVALARVAPGASRNVPAPPSRADFRQREEASHSASKVCANSVPQPVILGQVGD